MKRVRQIFQMRRQQGDFHNLLQEMRMVDHDSHFRYLNAFQAFSLARKSLYNLELTFQRQGKALMILSAFRRPLSSSEQNTRDTHSAI